MASRLTRALFLTHVEHEGPGALAELCRGRGLAVETLRLHAGAQVPAQPPDDALLVFMGGPMGVSDIGNTEFPFLRAEVDLLFNAVERDHPTLGICLGAQLLAHAAGARVFSNPAGREIGYAPVQLSFAADPELLAGLPAELMVLHWHGDTFDLPPGARGWASTGLCKSQAFRHKSRLIALQFHAETTVEMVDDWLAAGSDYVIEALGPGSIERISAEARTLESQYVPDGQLLLRRVLDQLLS